MVKIARLFRSFLTSSKPSRRSVNAAKRKEKEKKERRKKITKIEKPKDVGRFLVQNFDFCACPSQNVVKRDAGGKDKLPCCKCILDYTRANLPKIQPENLLNVRNRGFWPKNPGGKGLLIIADQQSISFL